MIVDEQCYLVHQIILPSANSHCHFHILSMNPCFRLSDEFFYSFLSLLPFRFHQLQLEAAAVHQMIYSCTRKRSTFSQLNVQVATNKKEN